MTKPTSTRPDLTGQTSGGWTVLESAGRRGRNYFWKCRCECGKVAVSR